MEKIDKICIAGPGGLASSALRRTLEEKDFSNIIMATSEKLNLLDNAAVANFFKSQTPDYLFLISYKSGSIQANINHPGEFIYENAIVQSNVIHNAYLNKTKKLLFFGASCIYPRLAPQPIREEYFLTGELESTSQAYAVAKIAGIEMCRAYNKQYGTRFLSIVPATLYGPGDHFDPESSHVLSALIRKFHEAKISNQREITLWGSGNPSREFLYIDDLADACLFLMDRDTEFDLINVGTGLDLTIKELADIIKRIIGFNGGIKWDISKPDGSMKKLLDVSRLESLGWKHKVDLEEGVKKTYQWFVENYEQLRSSERKIAGD